MKISIKLLLSAGILLGAASARAESAYMLEIGARSVVNTYISPLRYSGVELGWAGKWIKPMPRNMEMTWDAAIRGAAMQSNARNRTLYDGEIKIGWGMRHGFQPIQNLNVALGGKVEALAGGEYLPSNGNNPASAKCSFGLSVNARARYKWHIGRLPVTIADEVDLPSISLFFSEQYGEPYYEIYLGNHRGLLHAGWWGNHFAINNLLSATLHLGKRNLLLGYRFETLRSFVENIHYNTTGHHFVVGVTF